MTSSDRDTVMRVHLISGLPYDVVRDALEALAVFAFMNHLEGKATKIPFLGNLETTYKGDEISRKGKRAVVVADFKLDDFFVRNIGKSVDKETTDFENMTKKKILESLIRIEE